MFWTIACQKKLLVRFSIRFLNKSRHLSLIKAWNQRSILYVENRIKFQNLPCFFISSLKRNKMTVLKIHFLIGWFRLKQFFFSSSRILFWNLLAQKKLIIILSRSFWAIFVKLKDSQRFSAYFLVNLQNLFGSECRSVIWHHTWEV